MLTRLILLSIVFRHQITINTVALCSGKLAQPLQPPCFSAAMLGLKHAHCLQHVIKIVDKTLESEKIVINIDAFAQLSACSQILADDSDNSLILIQRSRREVSGGNQHPGIVCSHGARILQGLGEIREICSHGARDCDDSDGFGTLLYSNYHKMFQTGTFLWKSDLKGGDFNHFLPLLHAQHGYPT